MKRHEWETESKLIHSVIERCLNTYSKVNDEENVILFDLLLTYLMLLKFIFDSQALFLFSQNYFNKSNRENKTFEDLDQLEKIDNEIKEQIEIKEKKEKYKKDWMKI